MFDHFLGDHKLTYAIVANFEIKKLEIQSEFDKGVIKYLTEAKDAKTRRSLAIDTVIRISEMITKAGGMNATNLFQVVGAESETVFVLLGLNSDLKTIQQAQDQGAGSWIVLKIEKRLACSVSSAIFI